MPFKYILFAVMVVAQLAAPGWLIVKHERILQHGEVFKFRTAPVDPVDVFRGRYVWLAIEQSTAAYQGKQPLQQNQRLFAQIEPDSLGFARFSRATLMPPTAGPYLKTRLAYVPYDTTGLVSLAIPFDRYYMNEEKAPAAETLYRESNRWSTANSDSLPPLPPTYITVRILDGVAVLEELYVNDKPIYEALEAEKAR